MEMHSGIHSADFWCVIGYYVWLCGGLTCIENKFTLLPIFLRAIQMLIISPNNAYFIIIILVVAIAFIHV